VNDTVNDTANALQYATVNDSVQIYHGDDQHIMGHNTSQHCESCRTPLQCAATDNLQPAICIE
jgi:hypothetical protein